MVPRYTQVKFVETDDYFVNLPERVDMPLRDRADVFVSIRAHSVGKDRPDFNGLEVYYYDSGLDLAHLVRHKILQGVNVKAPRIRRARFYVLRKTFMPWIVVETDYVTGKEDMPKLKTTHYQNQMEQMKRVLFPNT